MDIVANNRNIVETNHSKGRFISPDRPNSSLEVDAAETTKPKSRFISPEISHCNTAVVVETLPNAIDTEAPKGRFISPENSQTAVMDTKGQESGQQQGCLETPYYASSPELIAGQSEAADSAAMGGSHSSTQDPLPPPQPQPESNNRNSSGETASAKTRKPVTRRRSIRSLIMRSESSEKVAPATGDAAPLEHQAVNGGVASDQRSGSHKLKASVDRKSSKKAAAGQIKANIEKEYVHETSLTYLQAMEQILQEADEDALEHIIQEISSVKQKRQSRKMDSSMDIKVPAEKPLELDHEQIVLESEPPTESSGIASMDMYEEDFKKRGSSLPAGMMLQTAKPYSKSMELSYSSVSPPCLESSPIAPLERQDHGRLQFTYDSMSNETLDSQTGDDVHKGYMYGYSSTPARPEGLEVHNPPVIGEFERDNGIIEGHVDSLLDNGHQNKSSHEKYAARSSSTLPAVLSTSKPPISSKPTSISSSHVLPAAGQHPSRRPMKIPGYVLSAKNIQGVPVNARRAPPRYVSPPEAKSVTLPRAWADEDGQPDPTIVKAGEEEKDIPQALLKKGHVLKKIGVFEQVVNRHTTSQSRLQGKGAPPPKVNRLSQVGHVQSRLMEETGVVDENDAGDAGDRPIAARRKHIKPGVQGVEDGEVIDDSHKPPEGSESNTSHLSDGYTSVLQSSIPSSDAETPSKQSQKSYLKLSVSSAGYDDHSNYGSDLKVVDISADSQPEREECEGQEEVSKGHVETSDQVQIESESETTHAHQNGYSVGMLDAERTGVAHENGDDDVDKHGDVHAVILEGSVSQTNNDLQTGHDVIQSDSSVSTTTAYSGLTDMLAADIVNEQIKNVYADLREQHRQKQQELQQQQQQQQIEQEESNSLSTNGQAQEELSVDFTNEDDTANMDSVQEGSDDCDVPKTSDSMDNNDLKNDQMTTENDENSLGEQPESTLNPEIEYEMKMGGEKVKEEWIERPCDNGNENFTKEVAGECSESDELVEEETRDHKECADETDQAMKLRDIVADSIQETIPKKDGHYFLNVMHEEERRLQHLCDLAEGDLQQVDLPDDVAGVLRAATGKAHLLLHMKFKQFGELCDKNLSPDPEDPFETRGGDLAGFWDMVVLQIEDVDSMFVQIDRMRANSWRELHEEKSDELAPLNDEKKMSSKVKTPVKHSPRTKTPRSEAAKARDEARKRMLAAKRKEMRIRRSSSGDEEFLEIFVPENVHPPS